MKCSGIMHLSVLNAQNVTVCDVLVETTKKSKILKFFGKYQNAQKMQIQTFSARPQNSTFAQESPNNQITRKFQCHRPTLIRKCDN